MAPVPSGIVVGKSQVVMLFATHCMLVNGTDTSRHSLKLRYGSQDRQTVILFVWLASIKIEVQLEIKNLQLSRVSPPQKKKVVS